MKNQTSLVYSTTSEAKFGKFGTLDLGPCTSKPLVEILGFVVLATHSHIRVSKFR